MINFINDTGGEVNFTFVGLFGAQIFKLSNTPGLIYSLFKEAHP